MRQHVLPSEQIERWRLGRWVMLFELVQSTRPSAVKTAMYGGLYMAMCNPPPPPPVTFCVRRGKKQRDLQVRHSKAGMLESDSMVKRLRTTHSRAGDSRAGSAAETNNAAMPRNTPLFRSDDDARPA